MEKIVIETNRLLIRNLKATDIQDFYSYRSNPDITKYQGFDVMSKDQASAFIAGQSEKCFGNPGEWVQYGIEDKSKKKIIGDCAIRLIEDSRMAEIGITISQEFQRKGFAKEAISGILQFLFEVKGLYRVVEIVDAENMAAIQLMQSLGFRKEGHFIENIFFKGKWGSEMQFAMLHHEWESGLPAR